MIHAMRCSIGVLGLLLVAMGCHEPAESGAEDEEPPVDVQALLWCVLTSAVEGETADGDRVFITTKEDACLCLPIGTQPYTGSELDALLHDMALDECEEDLRARGAVTTDCEDLIPERLVDDEGICDPDEWPPPPI